MIKIDGLCVRFGEKQVLSQFSEELPDSGVVMLFGESGVGKTTLLRVLCGLVKPQAGTVTGLADRKISVVFQEPRLIEHLTALENVAIVSDRQTAKDLLLKLNLEEETDERAGKLSGGQKQRVSLARAFAFSDDVVLLDEPFSGLDEQNKERAARLIRTAKLAIVVSHDASDAERLTADKIITL